jgi:hypothetical protein
MGRHNLILISVASEIRFSLRDKNLPDFSRKIKSE